MAKNSKSVNMLSAFIDNKWVDYATMYDKTDKRQVALMEHNKGLIERKGVKVRVLNKTSIIIDETTALTLLEKRASTLVRMQNVLTSQTIPSEFADVLNEFLSCDMKLIHAILY